MPSLDRLWNDADLAERIIVNMQSTILICTAVFLCSARMGAQNAGERIAYDYTAMYEALNPSIVKVHADGGTGSGFLVDSSGIIATNHHVVRNSRYLAVEFADGRKVSAVFALLDARHDLALLKVNKAVVKGTAPVPILPTSEDASVKAGIPVVAFGSPRSQTFLMTQGIVSKVEAGVLLGDFLIQQGNSGGPLVDLRGKVVGINTFLAEGISGAVRVNVLRDALAAQPLASYDGIEPNAEELPVADTGGYPTEMLKKKLLGDSFRMADYTLDGGRFTITAITPVLIGKAQVQTDLQQAANRYSRRAKKIKNDQRDPIDEPFYEWYRNALGDLASVVTFEVKPDFGQTKGSIWASVLTAAAAANSSHPVTPTHKTMEFKAEFQDLKLYKDGTFVRPITPGRRITEQSIMGAFMTFVDEAYSGWYVYHPSVFTSGKEFRLEVYDAREPDKVHKAITLNEKSKLIQQLRSDFEGVFSQ